MENQGNKSESALDGANQTSQPRIKKPATGKEEAYLESLSLVCNDVIVHAKAARYIGGMYMVGQKELNAVAIVHTWLLLNNRVNVGGAVDAIVGWSGARRRWKHSIEQAIIHAIELGCLEKFRHGPGYAIDITEKGYKILAAYDRRFHEIKLDINSKRIARLLIFETKRINKETSKKAGKRYSPKDYPELSEITIPPKQ